VAHLAGQAIFGFGLTVALIVGIVVAYRRRRDIRAWLEEHRRHPLVRPLFAIGAPLYRWIVRPVARFVAPYARFLGERLTPGALGLELTTLMAIGGVGLFVFVVYVTELDRTLAPTPLDNDLLELGDRLRTDMLVDLAKVVTHLGAFPLAAALVTATSVLLAVRRRYAEIVVLVVGLVLVYIAVNVTKEAIDRPRPTASFVGTSGDAYPSGHSAYAATWVAAGFILTRRLRLAATSTLVFVGIGIAAAVGVSRVYLRAHWWSDVAGGWGLAAAIFALLGAIVLVVEHIRNNGEGT
jgi:membrane-associated phospholipid phosphatase